MTTPDLPAPLTPVRSTHDVWFYAPDGTTEETAGPFAYAEFIRQFGGSAEALPDGHEVISGRIRIRPRPDDATADWPVGQCLVLVTGMVERQRQAPSP